jgi:hypothetical protein
MNRIAAVKALAFCALWHLVNVIFWVCSIDRPSLKMSAVIAILSWALAVVIVPLSRKRS